MNRNATGDAAITLHNVAVRFQRSRRVQQRRFEALHDVSMQLFRGEKLGIIGANGAGKSTLLRVLVDVLKPDAGRIERNHGSCRLLALGVGFMPNLSGRENAVLSGLLQGLRRREVVSRLEQIKEFSELGDFFDEPLRTYSSGMRARLGFAVAIQHHPDILLIDETLAVGDAAFKAKSLAVLHERLGRDTTVVLVSHDERMIKEVCDRVVWLEQGRVVDDGDPVRMLDSYRSTAGRVVGTTAATGPT
ncbi:MAG TPA: ABC transporter ATP-binding protein [Gammaproteobacteria bacterium]|nr:ABC transporter ATP-binding protein [Gammaproteobacteria bacterium]